MKFFLIISTVLSLCLSVNAQYTKDDDTEPGGIFGKPLNDLTFRDRLFTGGNVGFNIFNNYLFLDVSPIIGYKITDKIGAGVGVRYSMLRNMTSKTTLSNYGGSLFARYKIIPQAFLHAELEALRSYDYNPMSPQYGERAMAYMGFVGAGYSTNGSGLNFSILLLYDLIDHINSPYRNAYLFGPSGPPIVVRGGVTIGF